MNFGLNLYQSPQLYQTMQLFLSPRMLALLKTLQLPYAELIASINKEAESNPLLEVTRPDELLEYAKSLRQGISAKKEADYDPLDQEKDVRASELSLEDHLLMQLRLESIDELDYKIGEVLIRSLDEKGYLTDYPACRDGIMRMLSVKRCNVDKVLSLIQTFEPEGIAARNVKECLVLQIEGYAFESDVLRDILLKTVKGHLDDLAKKNYAGIAKALDLTEEGVVQLARFIEKNLTATPASGYRTAHTAEHVIPSFQVTANTDGTYAIANLEEEKGPSLAFNQHYVALLEDPKTDPETKAFLQEKFEAAKQFMENIRSRHQTVQKIIDIISKTQADFFKDGVFMMRPLMQKELAAKLGVHRSTISRAVSTKYIYTPQGVFPLKFLCPRDRSGYSPNQIKGLIKTLIRGAADISDQKVCDILQSRGIDIKRRTVTKYRHELNIGPSFKR